MIFTCLDTITMLLGQGEPEPTLRRGKRQVHGPPGVSSVSRLSSEEIRAYKAAVNAALYARPTINPEFATKEWVVRFFLRFLCLLLLSLIVPLINCSFFLLVFFLPLP